MTQLETKLKSNDLFGSLQPEQEQELDRIPEIKSNPNLEYLIKEYEMFMEKATDFLRSEKLFDKLKFDNKHLISKNIEEFSLVIEKYQKLKNFYLSGFYLSKAINYSNDKEFTIHIKHLDSLIEDIGYKNNGKTITINGNAGDFIGDSMKSGKITVNGDVGDCVGYCMDGGTINIKGNAGNLVGYSMKNGNITVNENAGDWVGYEMINGTINLNGKYKSLSSNIKGGDIYHKGKLIVENGRKIK